MPTNTEAFTPDIIDKIVRYKDEYQGLGRPPNDGHFLFDSKLYFYSGSRLNIVIETTLNHFDGEDYYIADRYWDEDVPHSFQALSKDLLDTL